MIEKWKEIDSTKRRYSVSNLGRVRNNAKGTFIAPYILHHNKYYVISLSVEGKPYRKMLHWFVADAFIPNPENKPRINHLDGNKSNNSATNLEWCTHKENISHAWQLGLKKSETNGRAKLTIEQVREIKEKLSAGVTVRELLKTYPVTNSNIYRIKNKRGWKQA